MFRTTIVATTIAAAFIMTSFSALAGTEAQGTFKGASGHVTSGGVEIVQDGDGYVVKLAPNFSLDNAPDPKVGFGKDGKYVEGTLIGKLDSLTGEQTYRVPAALNAADFTEVFIWCEKFSVPLGVATVK